jgi:hypothetical protein
VRIIIDGKDIYQLDGDVVGESTTLTAEIQPGALAICVPARATNEPQLWPGYISKVTSSTQQLARRSGALGQAARGRVAHGPI